MAIIDKGFSYAHPSASVDRCPTTAASAETSTGSILYQINLGQHHLVLRDDQSIQLAHNDKTEQPSQGLSLDSTETYRLMMCLHDLFKPIH